MKQIWMGQKAWIGAAAFATTMAFASGCLAGATTVTVPGTSNPFLTGYPNGGSVTINGYTDTAPAESPAYAGAVSGGERVTFSDVTGTVNNGPCCAYQGPNGTTGWPGPASSSGGTTVGGYSDFPINALVGVFYEPGATQGVVNSSTTTLSPAVNQVFFIGDGSLGSFVVPTGATELYLGTTDGYEWNNNGGAFTVTVSTAVPEPSTWATLLAGFAGLGFAACRRSRAVAVA